MSNNPLITVIVPVYNAERYLRRCLDSILQQSLEKIEILAVDDGSKDHSADILKEYITLLSAYEGQGIEGTEKEWTNKEIGWANQMLDRISRI